MTKVHGTVKLIPNWQNKTLRCYFCGSDKSVKYQIENRYMNGTIFCCNRCVVHEYSK